MLHTYDFTLYIVGKRKEFFNIKSFGFFRVYFGFSGRVESGSSFFGFGSGRVGNFDPNENSSLKTLFKDRSISAW